MQVSKSSLRQSLAESKLEETIFYLMKVTESDVYDELNNLVVHSANRFKEYQSEKHKGTLSYNDQSVTRNQIVESLLTIIDGLPDGKTWEVPKYIPKNQPILNVAIKKTWWKWVVGIGLILAIPAAIAEMSGYSIRDFISGTKSLDNYVVTVFVHGKGGLGDRILRDQGQVILYLGTDARTSNIGKKGEAIIPEIPKRFIGQKVRVLIDHPQPYQATHPDSLYELTTEGVINLEVALQNTDRIFGKVMDFKTEKWLDSVRVSIMDIATYTDKHGWFELEIPEDKQAKFHRVSFEKEGYQIHNLDSIPVHTRQEMQVSLTP